MKHSSLAVFVYTVLGMASIAPATVFINEVFINPPGSLDITMEYVELLGTPGKRLDGYAIAFVNGTEDKYYPLDSIPPLPSPLPEIDELFSLDGLGLGPNGILVLGISNVLDYPDLLVDSSFRGPWTSVWNGSIELPGKLENDGSNTIMLIRNRPGATEADPDDPGGGRWRKDGRADWELITPVVDDQDGIEKDQFGDGELDEGQENGLGGSTVDFVGSLTPGDITDDLEVVDEVSYEHERGWEYDVNRRRVDQGSVDSGLPRRKVHALDDPQGFNPDCLTRVDYRLEGEGWTPAGGAIGEMPNGNNWQDTATEQWIRGEATFVVGRTGPEAYYGNNANANPDAIQPFTTHVPLWLDDGVGDDYDFSSLTTYRIMAGRTNPLAVPFIPGDADRDGDCDGDDIARIAAVFGNDDRIFSNGYPDAPHGVDGDPSVEIRPWDIDATGNNGIEPSDLQWTLNFQGDTTGRIVGRTYDSETPAAEGVYLGENVFVVCAVDLAAVVPSGRPLMELEVGDVVELTLSAEVTVGTNSTPGRQNGIMQFVHDLGISNPGVVAVTNVEALPPYQMTRLSLLQPEGDDGDLGISLINGHTTSFTEGLSGAVDLYRVTLEATGIGSAELSVMPSTETRFALSAWNGLKVGHTANGGDPTLAAYPEPLSLGVTDIPPIMGNCDDKPAINLVDYACYYECMTGPGGGVAVDCGLFDFDEDADVDLQDLAAFQCVFADD